MTRSSRNLIGHLLFVTYGTVMLELTIKRNNVTPGKNVWRFGQIVTMVITVGGINEVVHFFLGKEWGHETVEDEQDEGKRVFRPYERGTYSCSPWNWNPRPMLLFPAPGHCSPWHVFVPRLVFGFPVQAVSPSNLNQIR